VLLREHDPSILQFVAAKVTRLYIKTTIKINVIKELVYLEDIADDAIH
jgi:hypothetical protein